MKKLHRVIYDIVIFFAGFALLSAAWVSMHIRNHSSDAIDQAIEHSKFWLVGIGAGLAVAVALFRPSADR